MNNDTLRIDNFQTRVTALYQSYGKLDDPKGTLQAEVQETVDDILWAVARFGGAYDTRNDGTRYLSNTRLKLDNLLTSVRVAIHGALVEAEEEWGGIENAPQAYRASLCDLRDMRGDLRTLQAEVDRTCAPVAAILK